MSAAHFNLKKSILLAMFLGVGLITGVSAQAEENDKNTTVPPDEMKRRVTNDHYIKIIEKQEKTVPTTHPLTNIEKPTKKI